MTVRIIETGEQADVNKSYGQRLIEQGKAVPVPGEKKAAKKGRTAAEDEPKGAD